ncbi:MAG: RusA family crossover junction endodeoxyribonuclease [Pyramidobacter sp.]|uniref:RusA family crossover junction endodeoxyribonuclease n=1 Tax=Pyramidobacter sp. TaxID=1943581 RepID=UPI0025D3006F|nr:RusA family crossover junction endodeoxyribonuclease [Pyramidobacter sp.]MCI7403922.1 RusA family crossover junction endodeoxyribonuclease [Pyramidobacter sp.]
MKDREKGILLHCTLSLLPPTVNHLYRSTRTGRRYKTERGRVWQEWAAFTFLAKRKKLIPYDGYVALEVVFYSKDKRRWDVDNRIKALQDALVLGKVIDDDKLIVDLHARRVFSKVDETEVIVKAM